MQNPTFIVLGASLDTGNLGVSALLASTVKCIHVASPTARIRLFDGVRNPTPQMVQLADGSVIELDRVGVRCNKTVWRKNHLVVLLLMAVIGRCLPKAWRAKLWNSNPFLRAILEARAVLDITGGDSFSDIYGLRRMILGSLRKILVILLDRDLILLPQTYGPYASHIARMLARWILRRAAGIYSRDHEGLDQITRLMGSKSMRTKPQFCPDVAFTLDAIAPAEIRTLPAPMPPKGTQSIIGFNVSGLLWNGGYSRDNMFGLHGDYKKLVASIVERLLEQPDTAILLVPHVFPDSSIAVESDPLACREVFNQFKDRFPNRIFLAEGQYNQSEIKYVIGQCDFFLGSRMHACIAAISQGIPAVGLAYSKKFLGVFGSVGIPEMVVDLRNASTESIVNTVMDRYQSRASAADQLENMIPQVQESIYRSVESFMVTPQPCEALV
jgi:colanic acid/amylovoran biosynthesis protein